MALVNVIEFTVLKYCTILCSNNSLCVQITSEVDKIWKIGQHNFAFILNIHSETFIAFGQLCVTMRKHPNSMTNIM